jgi:hypothetical protein
MSSYSFRRWWYRSWLHRWWDVDENKNERSEFWGIRWRRITRALWLRWYWRSWRRPTAMELEEQNVTRRCGEFRQRWLELVHADYEMNVSYDDERGAGHLAYLAYEAEVDRIRNVPIPEPRPYGWLGSDGSLMCCSESWDSLGSRGGYDHERPWPRVRPVTRRQAYRAMGWKYEPPPTEEEVRRMKKLCDAMSRIDTDAYTQTSDDGRFSFTMLGKEYFQELGANLHEMDADPREVSDDPA